LKILVCIANYGSKNDRFLSSIISEYRQMNFSVRIILLSNLNKDFGKDVETVVGLPTKNPWSLPFGYKKIFYENSANYDLFIYSEDDTLIKENNIRAFLNVTNVLPENEIAGFLRYEKYGDKDIYYTTVHSHFHWDPNSVKTIKEYTFAYYTNEHAACFILTKEQLKKAIQSGGFMKGPREGRYDMLCTASTDPYTQCGFRKVICISHLDLFSLHHMPNVYRGKMGIKNKDLEVQISTMKQIEKNAKSSKTLFRTKTKLKLPIWDKKYYEPARFDIINLIPKYCDKVLSIGCGSGSTEYELVKKGKAVTGIPVDSIIGASAEVKGIQILEPDFEKALSRLKGHKFNCLLFIDILQFLDDPVKIMHKFNEVLEEDGLFIVSLPNLNHISVFRKIILRDPMYDEIIGVRDYQKSGLQYTSKAIIKKWFHLCGIKNVRAYTKPDFRYTRVARFLGGLFDFLFSSNLVACGQKSKE